VTGVVHRISTLSSGPKAVVSRTSARFQATLSAWPSVVGQSIDANGFSRAFLWQNGVMADLNTLVPPGSPFLVYANDINHRSEIAGQACVVSNRTCVTTSAFLTIPRLERDNGESASSTTHVEDNSQKVILPERLRQQLEQRWGFGLLEGTKMPQSVTALVRIRTGTNP